MRPTAFALVLASTFFVASSLQAQTRPPYQVSSADGKSTLAVGFLAQPQVDWDNTPGATTDAVGFRRLRLIAGGKVFGKVKFFVQSDSPNLSMHSDTRVIKHEVFLQDLIVTYDHRTWLQVDAGLLMVPLSYNTTQSAASLLTAGYGPYSFASSALTTSKYGRDYGAQVRGYLVSKHLEYRLGAFEGIREIDGSAPPRYAGRVAWHFAGPQTGFFYTGTTLGKSRLLVVGASADHQADYDAWGVDGFWDQPVRDHDAVTLQADLIRYSGGRTFKSLADQRDVLVEGGYFVGRMKSTFFLQWARKDVVAAMAADTTSWQAGAAYWIQGYRMNVRAAVARVTARGVPPHRQLIAQTQFFIY